MNAEKKQDDKPTEPKKDQAPATPKVKEEAKKATPEKEKAPAVEPKAKEEVKVETAPKKEKTPKVPKEQKKLPTKIPSAQKRDLQNKKRRAHRKSGQSKINTTLKSFSATLQKEDRSLAQEKLSALYSLLDKGTKTKLIKKSKASKIKSKLTMLLKGKA